MIAATYVSATTFTVIGDQTSDFHVGRRIKHVGDTTGYGTIESVSIPVADTQVVLTAASDDLDASLTGVLYGIVSSYEPASSIPVHAHDGDEGSGGFVTGGIAFPATAVPSSDPNTLDDYEEGTFTATLACGTSGTITLDASFNELAYVKIGSLVHIQGLIKVDSVSSPVGTLKLNTLPFTSANLTDKAGKSVISMVATEAVTINNFFAGIIDEGVTGILIVEQQAADYDTVVAEQIQAGTSLFFSGSYIAA